GPSSARLVTATSRPPRPPGVAVPKPSAPSKAGGAVETSRGWRSKVVKPHRTAWAFMPADYAIDTNRLTENGLLGFPVRHEILKWTSHFRGGGAPPHGGAGVGPGLSRRDPRHHYRLDRRRAAG